MLNKKILTFLTALRKNNNKRWFEEHKDQYKELHSAFGDTVRDIATEIAKFDPQVRASLTDKKTVKIFRIYRDARFSRDKSPYKTNFGGVIAPNGMDSGSAVYYIHLEPGNSFIGGGLHHPEPERLHEVREHIVAKEKTFRKILADKKFTTIFPGLDDYDTLKTVPRGYDKDHPAKDLLRYKSLIASRSFSNKEVINPNFKKEVITSMKALKPLNDFLSK